MAGAIDKRRCTRLAKDAVTDARQRMDITSEDIAPDLAEWERIERELSALMFCAYARNHNVH